MRRLQGGGAERIIRNHEDNVRSLVKSFRQAAEKFKRPATADMREDAFSGMWQFAPFRKLMRSELELMASHFRAGEDPPNLSFRIARLGLALYFLEKLERMVEAVAKDRTAPKVALFDMARKGISNVLDEQYFSKDNIHIMEDYLDAEVPFRACAEACGVQVFTLEQAVRAYHLRAADMIDEINGVKGR